MPFAPSAHPPHEVRQWVAEHLVPGRRVHVAEVDGQVVAAMALSEDGAPSWIEQMYVLPGFNGRGIGSQLLRLAHETLGRPIRLYTFLPNAGARRFYERHGYRVIECTDGRSNEERCPDVLFELVSDPTPPLTTLVRPG